jgi:serine/threonine protein kinase
MNSWSTAENWIGRYLGDNQRYRLDHLLGQGGMSDVYVAMDTRVGQQVALKLLKNTLLASEHIKKRFEREVAVCAALQSDHIVRVSDYGVSPEGYPFYVMEYLRGETLRQLLQRKKRLSVEETVKIMTQICEGLRLAHEGVTLWREGATVSEHIKVVHRDLKPDNIFLIPTELGDWIKILDFGIAKIRNESSEHTNLTQGFLGTLRYAAPEQLKGDNTLDERADIYSLGIILYEMLSGADPFGFSINARNQSQASWIWAHTSVQPQPLRLQPGCEHLSPALEAVVMRCLHKEPNKRFASVSELNEALQAAAINPDFPPTPPEKQKTISLIPIPQLIIFGIGVVLMIIGGIYLYLQFQPRKVLEDIQTLKREGNYQECIAQSETVSTDASFYQEAQAHLNDCRLEYAQKLGKQNYIKEALEEAKKIPIDSPRYSEAQALIKDLQQI